MMSEPTQSENGESFTWDEGGEPFSWVIAHVLIDESHARYQVWEQITARLDNAGVATYRFWPREIWMRRTIREVGQIWVPVSTADAAKSVKRTLSETLADVDGVTKYAVSTTLLQRRFAYIAARWFAVGEVLAHFESIALLKSLPRNWRGRRTLITKLNFALLSCVIAGFVSLQLLWLLCPYLLPWLMFATGPVGTHNWLHGAIYWLLLATVLIGLTRVLEAIFGKRLQSRRKPNAHTRLQVWRHLISEGGSAVVIGIAQLVGAFAAAYSQAYRDHHHPPHMCFDGGPVHHLDAIYFTIGTLTTAGTGTLQPVSHLCRSIAAVQMVTGLGVIGLGVGGLVAHLVKSGELETASNGSASTTECACALGDNDADYAPRGARGSDRNVLRDGGRVRQLAAVAAGRLGILRRAQGPRLRRALRACRARVRLALRRRGL